MACPRACGMTWCRPIFASRCNAGLAPTGVGSLSGKQPLRKADEALDAGLIDLVQDAVILAPGKPDDDTGQLCRLDPRHARMIWRWVEGERLVRGLRAWTSP